ncbi:MAG: HAD family hydrolase [Dehalococcoidia bacterium]
MRRILLFDIDMTMIRTDGAGRAAMEQAFHHEFGIERATEGILFDGRTDRGIFFECLERHGFGGPDAVANFHRFAERYLEFFPGWIAQKGGIVLPGVVELLTALESTDAVVGLATGNLRRGAAHKLGHFGLWQRFPGGGFGDDHTVRAELVRAGILELEGLFELPPGECEVIVLGDTPLDVEAAHLAGARAFGVGTGRFTPKQLIESGAEFALPDLSDTTRAMEFLLL